MRQIDLLFYDYYFKYWHLAYYAANRILKNRQAAEDVAEDVFETLYKTMLNDRPPQINPGGWITVTAERKAFNYLRNNKRLVPLEQDVIESSFSHDTENRIFLSKMLDKLYKRNKKWFDIVDKYYILGMSTREIAKEYGCSEQAVRNCLQRAKAYLKKEGFLK